MSYDYIRFEDVLAIHSDQIERYGGSQGLRDPGLLEAALFRPQTGYYQSLIDEAAALWESLSQIAHLLMETREPLLRRPMFFY